MHMLLPLMLISWKTYFLYNLNYSKIFKAELSVFTFAMLSPKNFKFANYCILVNMVRHECKLTLHVWAQAMKIRVCLQGLQ